jgi:hypothetical protein
MAHCVDAGIVRACRRPVHNGAAQIAKDDQRVSESTTFVLISGLQLVETLMNCLFGFVDQSSVCRWIEF